MKAERSASKKITREKTVEFDFSYKTVDSTTGKCAKHMVAEEPPPTVKFCPKHNCCNQSLSLDKQKSSLSGSDSDNIPSTSKSYRVPNCDLHPTVEVKQTQTRCKCENLVDLVHSSSKCNQTKLKSKLKVSPNETLDEQSEIISAKVSSIKFNKSAVSPATARKYHRSNINLDTFKCTRKSSGGRPSRSTSQKSIEDVEIFRMKDRISHAEVFLEAMGNAMTAKNNNSSRFGKYIDIEFNFRGDPIGGHITHCEY
jgi:myosin heavy subunit